MILIEAGEVYAPEPLGQQTILVGGQQILAMVPPAELQPGGLPVTRIPAEGKLVIPGLVDALVHFTGGGGEGGFATRTPEMPLSSAILGGTTTMVGALGTDAITRSLADLLAKARGLEEEGISCYCYTGAYQVPVKTLLDGIQEDLILIDKFVGVGEVAISDHRSSQPTTQELARIGAQARVGGMLSGKAGIVLVHVGDEPGMLTPLHDVANLTDVPLSQYYPTHVNRHAALLEAAIPYTQAGGTVDLTTSTTPELLAMGEVAAPAALKQLLDRGVDPASITFSSDGNASLPCFDASGSLVGLTIGAPQSLFAAVRDAVLVHGVGITPAVSAATRNPASVLKLSGKGRVSVGADADLLIVDPKTWQIETVIARGTLLMHHGQLLRKGRFE